MAETAISKDWSKTSIWRFIFSYSADKFQFSYYSIKNHYMLGKNLMTLRRSLLCSVPVEMGCHATGPVLCWKPQTKPDRQVSQRWVWSWVVIPRWVDSKSRAMLNAVFRNSFDWWRHDLFILFSVTPPPSLITAWRAPHHIFTNAFLIWHLFSILNSKESNNISGHAIFLCNFDPQSWINNRLHTVCALQRYNNSFPNFLQ